MSSENAQPVTYDYNTDKVKYYTFIREFEYDRPNPLSPTPKTNPLGFFSLPLPVNMPGDVYQEAIREFNLGEIGTSVDLFQKGISTASTAEKIGTALTAAGLGGIAYGLIAGAGKHWSWLGDMVAGGAGANLATDLVGAFAGYSRNPHTAMIFDRMTMRSFNLRFLFAPRRDEQSRELDRILTRLRSSMHPSFMDGNAFVLNYPRMFTVDFKGLENRMGVPKIDFSFLKSLNINSTPQGQVYFKDGWPALMEVEMEFVELEMKTSDYFDRARAR
jgi:hypothetical protein